MNQTNYLKLFAILAFLAFAIVSCWATAESLHLLLSSWPLAMCWIVTIGFFVIASIGSKMIVDSLNQNIYMERRGANLLLGIIIMLVFWLICSFPTNTHTFFYRTIINDKVSADISTTRGYLTQIKLNSKNVAQAELQVQKLKADVESLLGELTSEIMNEANPGFGKKSKEILRKFAPLLGVPKIEPLTTKGGTSVQARQNLCDAYRQKMYVLRDAKARTIINTILSPNPANLKEAEIADKNLGIIKNHIDAGQTDIINLNDADDIKDVCNKLNDGYNAIKKNSDFVNFSSGSDKEKYTAASPITDVKRMISVFDVWEDFLKGEYTGHGFAFWIVISILVDIAAFIFFDIAFKKSEE